MQQRQGKYPERGARMFFAEKWGAQKDKGGS